MREYEELKHDIEMRAEIQRRIKEGEVKGLDMSYIEKRQGLLWESIRRISRAASQGDTAIDLLQKVYRHIVADRRLEGDEDWIGLANDIRLYLEGEL